MKWEFGKGNVPLTNISHLGIAVIDAEKTAKFLSSIWAIGEPEISDYAPEPKDLFAGEPFKVRLVFFKFGAIPIELLQPLDDKSIWAKFIAEKGEGIHHIAFGISNYNDMVSKFQSQNQPMLVGAIFQGCRWCYFDTHPGGMVVEIPGGV